MHAGLELTYPVGPNRSVGSDAQFLPLGEIEILCLESSSSLSTKYTSLLSLCYRIACLPALRPTPTDAAAYRA